MHPWFPLMRDSLFHIDVSLRLVCVCVISAVFSVTVGGRCAAGTISNGEFTFHGIDRVDPFTGWQSDSQAFAPNVGTDGSNTFAVFEVQGSEHVPDLRYIYQSFELHPEDTALTFEYAIIPQADTAGGSSVPPDSFEALLFDSSSNALFPSNLFSDAYFSADNVLVDGVPNEFPDPFPSFLRSSISNTVVEHEGQDYQLRRVDLDLRPLALTSPMDVELEFALIGVDDGFETTVLLDNIRITQNVIPEPGAGVIWSMVAVGALVAGRRIRGVRAAG